MPVPDTFTVEIKGPQGVKIVELTGAQVRFFRQEYGDDYSSAVFLTACDLYARQEVDNDENV